jgi:pyruvate dehydrogenase E1 component alpha subunit
MPRTRRAMVAGASDPGAKPNVRTSMPTEQMTDRATLIAYLRDMIRIRRFEERCGDLYRQEKIRGFLHLYIGEEAVAVGIMHALTTDDAIVGTYREHGHALVRGIAATAIMAEMYGKRTGSSGGRGGSMHIFDKATRFFGGNAIVGGGLPLAVGLALADKLSGRSRVTACFFGDGAVAEGEFHESLNLAALWALPVLFCCENNLYAMGTALVRHQAEPNLAAKAASYRIESVTVDGMDVIAVADAAHQAIDAIRSGVGPRFLECRTYRFRAHSLFDPELYRSREEVEQWKKKCPILALTATLRTEYGLTDAELAGLEHEALGEVDAAVAFAEASEWEPVADLLKFVTSEPGTTA